MRIAICDDDRAELEQCIEALHGWDKTRRAECFMDGVSLLEAARQFPPYSIVFLDIYLPRENGIEIARELKKISPETGVVFVTTSSEHAVEAFSIHALHYLVKPVTTEGIRESFFRLTEQIKQKMERKVLMVSIGRGSRSLYMDEIHYLQSAGHATEITLQSGEVLKVWYPISELEKKMDESFLKIQRGIIVNMNYIEQMGIDSCRLRNGMKILLSRKMRSEIRAAYDDYIFGNLSKRQNL